MPPTDLFSLSSLHIRLPGDLMEKMPSAANSPIVGRRSNATSNNNKEQISNLVQAAVVRTQKQLVAQQQHQQQQVSEVEETADEVTSEVAVKKVNRSVASMVQRFEVSAESSRPRSVDRARTRAGSQEPVALVTKRWPPASNTATSRESRSPSLQPPAEETATPPSGGEETNKTSTSVSDSSVIAKTRPVEARSASGGKVGGAGGRVSSVGVAGKQLGDVRGVAMPPKRSVSGPTGTNNKVGQ